MHVLASSPLSGLKLRHPEQRQECLTRMMGVWRVGLETELNYKAVWRELDLFMFVC